MKYWSSNNVGFLICDKSLEIKKRGLSEGRDKPKDILIKLYFVFSNSFSKAGKYFSIVQDKECFKSSDVDFINLNSGTGCAGMLKTSCVPVFESMISFRSCVTNELHVPNTHWNTHLPVAWNHTRAICFVCFCFCGPLHCHLTPLVWWVLALKVGNKNISAGWNFSGCSTVTATFADRIAGRVLQVQMQARFLDLWY